MTSAELSEAAAIVRLIGLWLPNTIPGARTGRTGSDFRRAVGDMMAKAESLVTTGTLPAQLLLCLNLARVSQATYVSFDVVRAKLLALQPAYFPGIAVVELGLVMILSQQCRINAGTTFTSRMDIDQMMVNVNEAFDPVETYAADQGDVATYLALVQLHASAVHDLTERGRPLPRMVRYEFAQRKPSLSMANRLYPDATRSDADVDNPTRADEIVAENKVVHPMFVPRIGRALSSA
jgi:prophage DNA circulation protein